MKFKKIKRVLAQFLIVAFMMPNLTVMAETKEPSEVVQTETKIEETIKDNNSETEKVTEDNTESISEEENITNKEDISDETLTNNEENNIQEETNKEETSVEENQEANKEVLNSNEKNDDLEKEETTQEEGALKGKTYNKVKAINPYIRSFSLESEENLDREEFRLKKEALENLEVLEPMTEQNYELTIANSDGSYEFIEAYDELDEAVSAARTLEPRTTASQEPAVINEFGQVVYSTNQMARLIKYSNNTVISGTVNLYSDASMTSAFTYVNPSYMDDAPVLDISGNAAKVMINGYEGWVNNNTASGNYDMILVPLTTVKNPSYYTVTNGELVHFISYDLTGTTGYKKILGKAPFFLEEGVRYLSYDGQYFYKYNHNDQADITNKLNVLINDYKSGVRRNAVNSGTPYYTYYLNLPFRSQTVYTAADLNNYINNNTAVNSKLRGLGQTFIDVQSTYGVNALLALGVAINESAYGTSTIALTKNNLFGIKAYDSSAQESASSFATPGDSVVDFAKNYISRGYADPADWRYFGGFLGNKNRGVNVKYASDPFWGEKASSFAYDIDKYLSGGSTNLRDTNSKQIGVATTNTSVIKGDGTLLYNVTNDTSKYGAYIYTPFVISNLQQVKINGRTYYEIYAERNTPVGSGGVDNKFSGNYNWNDKGYIEANCVNLTNEYQPPSDTLYGQTRYETAVELSKSQFTSAETIVIANGYALPDGLAATPIASHHKGPLLLVEKASIPASTQNEIKRLNAKNVIIVGGTGVVTTAVESQLRNLGITKITRLGGATRYDTALQVAEYVDKNLYDVENVVIANGYGEADALSIAPVSGRDKMPIILVESNNIPGNVKNWLQSEDLNTAYIIGGTGVVSDNVLNQVNSITRSNISGNRLGGSTRYETNAKVIERFYGEVSDKVYITEGIQLVDALTAGPVAALNNSPVVITGSSLTSTQRTIIDKMRTNRIVQVGGVVPKNVITDLRKLLASAQ